MKAILTVARFTVPHVAEPTEEETLLDQWGFQVLSILIYYVHCTKSCVDCSFNTATISCRPSSAFLCVVRRSASSPLAKCIRDGKAEVAYAAQQENR
jgi:hypothetical protein